MEVSFELVMSGDLIDRDTSIQKFNTYLTNLCVEQEKEQETISKAVADIFDKNVGKRIPIDYVLSQVLISLGAQPENHKALTIKVDAFLRANAGEGKAFNIARGKGIGRVVDMAA